jgi:hypothetical protein
MSAIERGLVSTTMSPGHMAPLLCTRRPSMYVVCCGACIFVCKDFCSMLFVCCSHPALPFTGRHKCSHDFGHCGQALAPSGYSSFRLVCASALTKIAMHGCANGTAPAPCTVHAHSANDKEEISVTSWSGNPTYNSRLCRRFVHCRGATHIRSLLQLIRGKSSGCVGLPPAERRQQGQQQGR